MKIAVIGGGPAGLYFSILVKKWRPEIEVDLYERNGPDDTFGWGVVFSDKTLSYLQAEDVASWQAIVDRFETWDNVDIIHRDEKVTVRGNKFSGIARIEMLKVLQRRCEELGVRLHFRSSVTDLSQFSSCDLVVGADGVMSGVRSELSECFKPDLSTRTNRYIWFGTPHLFHGLTLTFRQSSAGVFAAHSYKFNRELSTFIVECDEKTWDSAGFRDLDEDATRRYLEQVFHLDLQGAPLLSNNSKWINFVMVRNRNWWCGPQNRDNTFVRRSSKELQTKVCTTFCTTLLGDSLATAHFSIGSGTKLALEDAIALVHAMKATQTVPDALREYEAKRRPIVEEYQEAAWDSLRFFENLKDFMHLDPLPFAYKLMMRSGKVDHKNLRRRDRSFVERYEQFAASHFL